MAAGLARRCSTASRLSRVPRRVGNSGSGLPAFSASQARRRHGGRGERGAPFLSALAGSGRGLRCRGRRRRAEAGQLGDPQPGLDGERRAGRVAASGPGSRSGAAAGRRSPAVEEADDRWVVALGRDGQHPGDDGGVLGVRAGTRSGTASGSRPAGRCGWRAVAAAVSRWSRNAPMSGGVEVGDVQLRTGGLPVRSCAKASSSLKVSRFPRTWLSAVSTQEGGRSRLQGFGLAVMVCGAAWAEAGIPRSTVTRRLAAM